MLRRLLGILRPEAAPRPAAPAAPEPPRLPRRGVGKLIRGRDAWSAALTSAVPESGADTARWLELLAHCQSARSAKPSKKWLRRAAELVAPIGDEAFTDVVVRVLDAIGQPSSARRLPWGLSADPTVLDDRDTDLLRGLAWSTTTARRPETVAALGRAAEACFQKVRDHGPRNVKVGNACLQALSLTDDLAAVAELGRIRPRLKHASTKRQLEKALEQASARLGMDAAELEELATPDFGFRELGRRTEKIGDFTAEIRIESGGEVVLRWIRADGKVQKSVPKSVRENQGEALETLRKTVQEIRKARPALVARLERLYLHPREWTGAVWRERYADHPILGTLARRLVWRVLPEDLLVCFDGGEWMDVAGEARSIRADARVRLWHPIDSPPETVRAWRLFLEERGITQPFKQAHREIYLLTDAERQTATYSNRFAAHILRQHQFTALAHARGWRYQLMGTFDSHNTPALDLPQHGLEVQLWVEPGPEDDVSDMGIYLYVATDQVRFVEPRGPRRLESIPPLVFSETMRDVDLFVSVCSVGNDPTWIDGGDTRYAAYWESYSRGELGTMGESRHELLARLLPRLKIAERCSLTDRFLVVRGQLRTYKIHLGSSSVLMSPNDTFLCIVGERSKKPTRLVLPFEGDRILSLILSKAFLLAEDAKIKDRTISRQLRRR